MRKSITFYNHERHDVILWWQESGWMNKKEDRALKCGWFVAHFLCTFVCIWVLSMCLFFWLACAWNSHWTQTPTEIDQIQCERHRENVINCECVCFCASTLSMVFSLSFLILFPFYSISVLLWTRLRVNSSIFSVFEASKR